MTLKELKELIESLDTKDQEREAVFPVENQLFSIDSISLKESTPYNTLYGERTADVAIIF